MSDRLYSYVDEAGDPTIFGSRRGSGVIVGQEGCSKFFIIGKLEVGDPDTLSNRLTKLRHELLADPYFADVPSFKPERRGTAHGFHANSDLPEVRYQVFRVLRELGADLRFHAVVADKTIIAAREMKRRETNHKARYQPNSLYNDLLRHLYAKVHRIAGEYHIWVARRHKSDQSRALRRAIEDAEDDFEQGFGFRRSTMRIIVSDPNTVVCLQAADYFLWAVQRFYERCEPRFLDMMWPQITEIHDLHHGRPHGTFFTGDKRPTLDTVFPREYEGEKPRI